MLASTALPGVAQTVPAVLGQTGGEGGGALGSLLLFALLGLGFYLLLIRPQRRRAAAVSRLQASLAVGDEVVTTGGVVGTVVQADDREVVLETVPGTRLRLVRGAVAGVRPPESAPDVPGPDGGGRGTRDDHGRDS